MILNFGFVENAYYVNRVTSSLRDKDLSVEYRYMPESNLPPVRLNRTCSICDPSFQQYNADLSLICINCVRRKYDLAQQNSNTNQVLDLKTQLLLIQNLPVGNILVYLDQTKLYWLFNQTVDLLKTKYKTNVDEFGIDRWVKELSYWLCGQLHGRLKQFEEIRLIFNNNILHL